MFFSGETIPKRVQPRSLRRGRWTSQLPSLVPLGMRPAERSLVPLGIQQEKCWWSCVSHSQMELLVFLKCFILFSWGVCSDLYRVCLCFKAIYGFFIGFSRDFSVLQSVTVFSELWWFMMILSYYIYIYDITLTSAVGIDGGDIFEPRPPLARPFHFSGKWITWQLCVR